MFRAVTRSELLRRAAKTDSAPAQGLQPLGFFVLIVVPHARPVCRGLSRFCRRKTVRIIPIRQ
jgi:hypothetical protein